MKVANPNAFNFPSSISEKFLARLFSRKLEIPLTKLNLFFSDFSTLQNLNSV